MAKYLAPVRFGMMGSVENFLADIDGLAPGATVILKTERGIEWGEVSGEVQTIDRAVKGLGEIVRVASDTDIGIIRHIVEVRAPEEMEFAREEIRRFKLPMKLVGIEHLFSGDKVVYYFIADGRVDFRELVKDLARRYRTRIEMRQIGVRDEARLLADYEHCGRELCCRTFLRGLEPVTMRMAKVQKTTLDPTKISGHCGRLMCCLRYEDEVYSELRKALPRKGKFVVTPTLRGEVISTDVLKQTVTVWASGERVTLHVSEIVEVQNRPQRNGESDGGDESRRGDRREERRRSPRQERSPRSKDEASERTGDGDAGDAADAGEETAGNDSDERAGTD